jgi:NAD(P)H-nitrite reductase large subunit
MNKAKYVIIGNGVAGITAAQAIRDADQNGRILIISDEGAPFKKGVPFKKGAPFKKGIAFYYRAAMSEWLSGEIGDDALIGRTEAFYQHMALETMEGHVTSVEPEAHTLDLADGETLGYEKLLIATGARANRFPVDGIDDTDHGRPLVFRDFADARQIKDRLGECGRALILGGGILGLELAGALHKLGTGLVTPAMEGHAPDCSIEHIAVVQRSGFVGKPLLDEPAATWLQDRMRADGLKLFLNDTVDHVEGQTAHLTSGRTWDFDIFVQAVGISPTFPEVPGLTVGQGVRIDGHARTNLADIYAAGDCTETYHADRDRWQTTRIWLDCARQGKVAGRNMAGQSLALPDMPPFYNASVIYTILYSFIGAPHGDGGEIHLWQAGDAYRKVRVVDGRLAGALLMGNRHGSNALLHAIGQSVAQYGDAIVRPDFPYNDLSGRDWDYLFY